MIKGIISLSGGLDSSTLLAQERENIQQCVFFDYGSKQNEREWRAASAVAEYYNKPIVKIDARGLFVSFKSALLAHSEEEIQKGPYSKIEVSNAKVPFRNGIFVATLVGLAESLDCNTIYLAAHAGDHLLYPDCRPLFFFNFDELVRLYSGGDISIQVPFINKTKEEIGQIALALDVPTGLTYSCYNGGEEHCGVCPTCIERREALGLLDEAAYTGG